MIYSCFVKEQIAAQVYRSLRALRYPDHAVDMFYRVKVSLFGVNGLLMKKVGDHIPEDDDNLLSPGDYGWFKSPSRYERP